ncbi:acyloxyacyl hydrolase [Desulfosarcina sp. OttesenSCG-928-A07]|nr:acyloxyacyl hydrolase [Desulfosarcina sp. OttesenSCG-928-A07]
MKKPRFHITLLRYGLVLACLCCPANAVAGEFSLAGAVAHGEESSQAYDFYIQYTFDPWYESETITLKPLATGGISLWERSDKSIWGGNVNIGLMLQFAGGENWRSFIMGTFGMTVLSSEEFNDLNLGCREQFRSRGSLGISFGKELKHTLKCDVTHYSNASMAGNNDGYNTIGLSYGLAF